MSPIWRRACYQAPTSDASGRTESLGRFLESRSVDTASV
jgi:hypothetical protein